MSSYNVTITAQASTIRYSPERDGPIGAGWNLTYTDTSDFSPGANGIGSPSRRTTQVGASLEMDWVGTAAYLYGSAAPGTYRLSVDGGSPLDGQPEVDLLGKFEGLQYGNHTLLLEVTNEVSPVEFRQALLTRQPEEEGAGFENRTVAATIHPDGVDLQMNPFWSYTPPDQWRITVED